MAKSNPSLTYGALAGSSWFAVYGLTGVFKNTIRPNLNIGYDHYPVLFVKIFQLVKQSL